MDTSSPATMLAGVTLCPVHEQEAVYADDCVGCTGEQTGREAVLAALLQDGQQRAAGLAQQGIQMPSEVALQIKVDLLLSSILTAKQRLSFECEFGRLVVEELKSAQKAANGVVVPQSKLTVVRDRKTKG